MGRDEEKFLIGVSGGREELANRKKWVFLWKNEEYEIEVDKVGNADQKITDSPFFIDWDFVKISPSSAFKDLIINDFKDALTVYGFRGVRKKIPNTMVEFSF